MARKAAPKAPPPFRPFADDAAVQTLGDLSIESGTTRIALHGALDLTRDRHGLDRARRLRGLLADIVAALEEQELPDTVAERVDEPLSVKNPFA